MVRCLKINILLSYAATAVNQNTHAPKGKGGKIVVRTKDLSNTKCGWWSAVLVPGWYPACCYREEHWLGTDY